MQFDVQTRIIGDIASSFEDIYEFITDVLVALYGWIHFEKVSIWSFYTTEATAAVVWRQTQYIAILYVETWAIDFVCVVPAPNATICSLI